VFIVEDRRLQPRIQQLVRRLPSIIGDGLRIRSAPALSDHRGAVHGGAFLRKRRIAIESGLRGNPGEFARIFVHELFHFVWLRLGNPRRKSYEELVEREVRGRVAGELGWSAEWRKQALSRADVARRTRRWREYTCESFCDSAAWMFSGVSRHVEFTLPARFRRRRRAWFERCGLTERISI
jgi:hypothetical protein